MTQYKVFENFVTDEECISLYNWIIENYNSPDFKTMQHPGTIRKSTRFSKTLKYPDMAFSLQNRIDNVIKEIFSLKSIKRVPEFFQGMYASYGTEGDACSSHRDPVWLFNTKTYHFNVMLSEYTGAKLIIENQVVELNKKDGILYPVSEVTHSTTPLTGEQPRLFWCFGYCIPN